MYESGCFTVGSTERGQQCLFFINNRQVCVNNIIGGCTADNYNIRRYDVAISERSAKFRMLLYGFGKFSQVTIRLITGKMVLTSRVT
ncbi:hypothetical protein HMPREF3147_03250 [Corynebacterium sp. HMSC05D03]|nr:hypothetical protein HMPREF2781_07545 [Corynebacterium sp. HMSC062A03]OFP22501.1 hypothetical protein HMPREF2996_11480 [Corynebacterium sp. HMSC066C02]OFT66899.1 hypothetical protein HMPREF3147_03250 [Corynebacterium sp. HMSC05D03]